MSRAVVRASGMTPVDDPDRKCLKCGDQCPGFAPHFWRLVPSPLRVIIRIGIIVVFTYPVKTKGYVPGNARICSTEHVRVLFVRHRLQHAHH